MTSLHRLLVQANVTIVWADREQIAAYVFDNGCWSVKHSDGIWTCDCPAPMPCNHAAAVALVTCLPPTQRKLLKARDRVELES